MVQGKANPGSAVSAVLALSRKRSLLPKHSWVGRGLGLLIGDMTLVTAHCHRKVSSLGWEEEFTVFILTFCLLLALGLTGIGRIMAVSVGLMNFVRPPSPSKPTLTASVLHREAAVVLWGCF